MRHLLFLLLTIASISIHAQQKADTTWKVNVGDSDLGMILPDGRPIMMQRCNQANNCFRVISLDPATGKEVWATNIPWGGAIGYFQGTPYLDAGGYVINPANGAMVNLGKGSKTNDGKPIQIIHTFIFPSLNVVLVYGTVKGDIVVDNNIEVFCAIEFATGKTLWTRTDMFKNTEQKAEKKGLGGFLNKAGSELIKEDVQKFEDSKNPGERFLTAALASKYGTFILPLNMGVHAIDIATGNLVWKKEYPAKKKGMITTKTGDPTCVIAFNQDSTKLFVSRADFSDAVDVKSGNSTWKEAMPSAGPASFLHLSSFGILSLPTKDASLLQNKRIILFDQETGAVKWEIKQKQGVQAYIPMGDKVVLNLQNAGDRESVNILDLNSGKLLFGESVRVDGNILNMKEVASGILVVADEEICIISRNGEKISTLKKKKEKQQWVMVGTETDLFAVVSGENKLHRVDYASGKISQPFSFSFQGGESPENMEMYNGGLLVSSPQNLCLLNTSDYQPVYQKYYQAPGKTIAGKILSGYMGVTSLAVSLTAATGTVYTGMVIGRAMNSEAATVAFQLFPKETNKFFADQVNDLLYNAETAKTAFKESVAMFKTIGQRFKDMRTEKENVFVMGSDGEGNFALLQVSKKSGEVLNIISLRKRDKNPDYRVDEAGNCIYYMPQKLFGDDVMNFLKGSDYQLLKMSIQ
jgi:outer membrane protein assembly factor BamB